MAIKTVKGLIKDVYRKMRKKGRQPIDNKVIGKYLLFNGIRWKKDILEHMLADESNFSDPLDTAEYTRFFIDITKTIPGFKYKRDKATKEHVNFLQENKYYEGWKRDLMEKEKKSIVIEKE